MSQAASQAAAFYRDAVKHGTVWTVRDESGFPAPLNPEGRRAQPFWSSRSRVERVIKNVDAYMGFDPVEVGLEEFVKRWLPGLARDGLLVGVNWSGSRAVGYDIEPQSVSQAIGAQRRLSDREAKSS
jgi:hypothetical protein